MTKADKDIISLLAHVIYRTVGTDRIAELKNHEKKNWENIPTSYQWACSDASLDRV